MKALVLIGLSGPIGSAFIQTVCKTTMTYQAVFILTTASLAGQNCP